MDRHGAARGAGRGGVRPAGDLAFASALLGLPHEPAVAWIFILPLRPPGAAPFNLALEVRLSLTEFELYR